MPPLPPGWRWVSEDDYPFRLPWRRWIIGFVIGFVGGIALGFALLGLNSW